MSAAKWRKWLVGDQLMADLRMREQRADDVYKSTGAARMASPDGGVFAGNTLKMKHIKSFAMIVSLLAVVCGPAAPGATPPPGRLEMSQAGSGGGDLLQLDWHVYVAAKPIYCILVEKDRQRLRVLRHDGRLQVVEEYAAATGENPGLKEKEGDGKTPEGIYLITKGYLDRKLSVFGTRAFHLNFPNYFDLRAGRAGSGIYIHGTNKALRFNSSNGCVTLKNKDLDRLADFLGIGTPIFIVPSLADLADGKGDYPNLTERNFEGAKALLIPEASAQADFASLYLIRINGQTVVVGEYWADHGSAAPQLTVAYLQRLPNDRWAVVDRGPTTAGQGGLVAATINGLPPDLRLEVAELGGGDNFWPTDAPDSSWQASLEDVYLSWYRESSRYGRWSSASLGELENFDPSSAAAQNRGAWHREGLVYGLFALATLISIGSALVLIRRQTRRQGDDLGHEGGIDGQGLGPQALAASQVKLWRDEVRRAKDTLQTVQRRVDEEARNVESLEALQARMKVLEGAFRDKQAEIDLLSAERAAFTQQGRVAQAGQAEALSALQHDLAEVKERLDEARQEMAIVVEREEMFNAQMVEIRRLAEREMMPKGGEELQEVVAVCDSLRGQVQTMVTALQSSEMSRRQEEEEELGRVEAVMEAVQAYGAEMKNLQAEMVELRGVADTSGLEAVLQSLRAELRDEQAAKLELMSRLGRLNSLEEELAAQRRENEALHKESEARRIEAVTEKLGLESALTLLRQELEAEQAAKSELTSQLVQSGELEAELAALNRENEVLRKRGEDRRVEATAAKAALVSLRQELEAELTVSSELGGRLARIGELEAELAERDQEIESLQGLHVELQATLAAERQEQAAVKSELAGRLTRIGELEAGQEAAKAELASRLARIGELEAVLAERDQEIESLQGLSAERQAALAAEKQGLEAALTALRHELEETVQAAKVDLASGLTQIEDLEARLAERDQEIESLQGLSAERQAKMAAERQELESALATLRQELEAEQAAKSELTGRLTRMGELESELAGLRQEFEETVQTARADLGSRLTQIDKLEAELAERQRQIESLQGLSAERQAEMAAERLELESTLATLRQELEVEQSAKPELTSRLARLGELESELAGLRHEFEETVQAAKADLESRLTQIDKLEATVAERDQELETLQGLSAERQASLVAERQELESALVVLRQELEAEQAAKSELAGRLTRIDELEAALAERQRQIESLQGLSAERQAAMAAERQELESALATLRHEFEVEQAAKPELTSRLARISELEAALAERDQAIASLQGLNAERQAAMAAEKLALEATLASLRQELEETAQAANSDLESRLTRIDELEAALAERDQEIEALQGMGAERQAEMAAAKLALESTLAALRQELEAEQAAKSELADRLLRIDELETELAERQQEIGTLQGLNAERQTLMVAERQELESTVAALQHELEAEQAAKSELADRLVRIDELEAELAERQQETERLQGLNTERQAAMAAEKQELESALAALRHELEAEQAAKSELTSRLARMSGLETELAERRQEIDSLQGLSTERQAEMAAERQELESALAALRHELEAEQAAKPELTSRLARMSELETELAKHQQEIESLQDLNAKRQVEMAAERQGLESALIVLRQELEAEQAAKAELTSRLSQIGELEAVLEGQGREIETLRKMNEERKLEAAALRSEQGSELESLRQELREEQEVRSELASRLSRLKELETELAGRDQEIARLREANERATSAARAEVSRLEADIAELVLARQVEVTGLTSALQEVTDQVAAEQETAAALSRQVETLHDSLRQATEQHSDAQENAMADLLQEVSFLRSKVAELEKKAAISDGVVMVKGAHYLPGDVLRKWIGKEQ